MVTTTGKPPQRQTPSETARAVFTRAVTMVTATRTRCDFPKAVAHAVTQLVLHRFQGRRAHSDIKKHPSPPLFLAVTRKGSRVTHAEP